MGETSRIKLYNDFRNNAKKNGILSDFDDKYSDFSSWESKNFADKKTVKIIWNKSIRDILEAVSQLDFYEKFVCDLEWAKKTNFCSSSGGGGNTTTYSWDNYPCVVDLAKKYKIQLSKGDSYIIGKYRYFPNGIRFNTSTKQREKFYCPKSKPSQTTTDSSNTNQITQPPIPSELKDSEGVKKFQDWLDQNKKGWATGYLNPDGVLNKRGRGYGRFGPRTRKAWGLHKNEYLNQPSTDGGDTQQPNVVVAKPEQETRGAEYEQKFAQMKTDSDSLNQPLRQSSNKETIYSNKEPDFKGSPINVMNNEI